MKQNRIALISSIITSVVVLVGYTCFVYINCIQSEWLSDIFLALFGSSALIILTSIIGYNVEKMSCRKRIIEATCDFSFAYDIVTESENGTINKKAISKIVVYAKNKTKQLRRTIFEYYKGSFKKNKELKTFINVKLYNYGYEVEKLSVYLSYEEAKIEIAKDKMFILLKEANDIVDNLFKWMETEKFPLGENFEIGENFICEYENIKNN